VATVSYGLTSANLAREDGLGVFERCPSRSATVAEAAKLWGVPPLTNSSRL
jgi:hypothetical protein